MKYDPPSVCWSEEEEIATIEIRCDAWWNSDLGRKSVGDRNFRFSKLDFGENKNDAYRQWVEAPRVSKDSPRVHTSSFPLATGGMLRFRCGHDA